MEFDNEKAERVLRRVMPDAAMSTREELYTEEKEAERIRGFIAEKEEMSSIYEILAKKIRDNDVFVRSAREERAHIKKLEREYFLVCGDTFFSKPQIKLKGSLLSQIRELYIRENKMSNGYENAAKNTKFPRLMSLYKEISQDDKRHGIRMSAALDRLM